jgi:hypothetical protein
MLNFFLLLIFSFTSFADDRGLALELWKKRDDRASLVSALKEFEKLHQKNPQDIEPLSYLARGYFTLAEYHTEKDQEKKKTFEKARAFGEKGLRTNPDYQKNEKKDLERAIEGLTLREVDSLFWAAAALGKWAKLNGVFSSLGYKKQILSMVKKVGKLKPDFNHGAVPRYWGSFYAVAPGIAGGDMDKSKENFKKSLKMAPEYLGTHVLFAELYWVKRGDKSEFKSELGKALSGPLGPEDIAPDNKLEKKKAERLLKEMDEIFD